jgi:hypothetical protein
MVPVVTTTEVRAPKAWRRWAFGVLAACDSEPLAPLPVDHAPPACVSAGPVTSLSPQDGGDRHHPTVDRAADGTLWVTWQRGMRPAAIEVGSFHPDLSPRTPPVTLSGAAARPTHPQVAVGGGRRVVVWTDEEARALRAVSLDDQGRPLHAALSWPGVSGMPLYPDAVVDAAGVAWVVWYEERPAPSWWFVQLEPDRPVGPTRPLATHDAWWGGGGPAGLATDGGTRVTAAWAEVAWRPWGLPVATVRWADLAGGEATGALPPEQANAQRTALAVAAVGAPVAVGWTAYPGARATPGVGARARGATFRYPGRMLDLLDAQDAAWIGWDVQGQGLFAALQSDGAPCRGAWRVADPASGAERAAWVTNGSQGVALLWQAGGRRGRGIFGQTLGIY